MATSNGMYVGIDVSKDRLDVAVLGEKQEKPVDTTLERVNELVQWMVVDALFHARLPVTVVNPARVRQFARACGLLAKTDQLDAQVRAVFGQRVQPRLYVGKSEAEKQLSALLVRCKQVEEMLKAEQNRLRTISRGSVKRILAILKAEQIQQLLKEQKAWQKEIEILSSAPGVGMVTTATLLAELPELGKMDCKKIAALVGIAPMNFDSGKKRGYRKTKGGRADVRSVLYMSTLVATRYNPLIRPQYQQLLKRGKEKKVAITACMRKFLIILNAMLRDQQPFRV